jgi:integrase
MPAGRAAQAVGRSRRVDRLFQVLDVPLLVSVGWDPVAEVFAPDRDHPLLGYRVCPVAGCGLEAWHPDGLCSTCRARFAAAGGDLAAFCAAGAPRRNRSRDRRCLVCRTPGFERPVGVNDLCLSCDGLRRRRGQSVAAYVDGDREFPAAVPRRGLGLCTVCCCGRLAAHESTGLCGAHDAAWRRAGGGDLVAFRAAAPPCYGDQTGRVVLMGLPAGVVAEILYAVQACLAEGRRLMIKDVRAGAQLLRHIGAASIGDVDTDGRRDPVRWFLRFASDRATLARSDPETEAVKDVWDLRVFGAAGRLSFVGSTTRVGTPSRPITQPWLKHAAQAWAAEALVSMTSGPVRAVIAAVGLLSEHLGRRDDGGVEPAALSHADVAAFLARLAALRQAGALSVQMRARTITGVERFLRDCREMGLRSPGSVLATLPDDVVVRRSERPRTRRADDEVGRALPDVVMRQLLSPDSLALLRSLSGPTVTAAVELGAGVGRRTGELCTLEFSCLDFDEYVDSDGQRRASPILVHDMPKVGKTGCRLPIHEREAAIIRTQQARVRAAFPDTPLERLALFPRPLKNPDGSRPLSTAHLQRAVREWVTGLPRLDGPEHNADGQPVPFDRDLVCPYSFRHTFAQRHADAGTPVDTLQRLLGHDTVRTTLGYYRVTAKRTRDAQDRLGPLQIDADARLVRPTATALTDTQAARDQTGQVAVPYGICTEPTNVAAGGHSCPYRHRCTGCTYFRTDPSYSPELRGYLARLLADRERLAASVPALADWARADAAPTDAEINAVRQLLHANDEIIAGLTDDVRAAVDEAITTIRTQRAALQISFPAELQGLTRPPQPVFFPTIARRATRTETDHG